MANIEPAESLMITQSSVTLIAINTWYYALERAIKYKHKAPQTTNHLCNESDLRYR